MTLRLRLLLLVVGIVALGLVASDVVTYNALRSFLTTRVDQQLEVAAFPVGRALLSAAGLAPDVPAAPPDSLGVLPGGTGSFRTGGGLFGPGRAPGRGVLVPPGTYGQLSGSRGVVEAHLFFAYGGRAPPAPIVPAKLPGSGLPDDRDIYFTTSGTGPGALTYRALAKPLADGKGVVVVAVPLSDLESTLRHLLWIELIVSAVLLVGLAALSWAMVRRDLRPLESMTRTAGAIARGDLTQRVAPVSGATEVGQLGEAFNTMIDEIEGAFAQRAASEERLRRFLADASHELRTPLTSMVGYSELFDLGMKERPADLALALGHIREEAGRMARLVDDLFLLAQLDHERPLRHEPVELVGLAHRAVEGLAVAAPDRPVVVDARGPVVVDGDPDRLRQVVDNLLGNALVHTPPGTKVVIGVAAGRRTSGAGGGPGGSDGGGAGAEVRWAVITVHDDGPGIDPADAPRIFEAFYRSDPSRSRTSGGAGLGLAIVAAIVRAHGGAVGLRPGPGTTFEVSLPMVRDHGDPNGSATTPAQVVAPEAAAGPESASRPVVG